MRAYAETQLIIAESKGKISHPYLQFIAGHKGDIESRYSTNKGKLPPDMIEDIRTHSQMIPSERLHVLDSQEKRNNTENVVHAVRQQVRRWSRQGWRRNRPVHALRDYRVFHLPDKTGDEAEHCELLAPNIYGFGDSDAEKEVVIHRKSTSDMSSPDSIDHRSSCVCSAPRLGLFSSLRFP